MRKQDRQQKYDQIREMYEPVVRAKDYAMRQMIETGKKMGKLRYLMLAVLFIFLFTYHFFFAIFMQLKMREKLASALSLVMIAVLVFTCVDVTAFAATRSSEDNRKTQAEKIITVEELSEEILYQTLQVGATEDQIHFPETLTVTVAPKKTEQNPIASPEVSASPAVTTDPAQATDTPAATTDPAQMTDTSAADENLAQTPDTPVAPEESASISANQENPAVNENQNAGETEENDEAQSAEQNVEAEQSVGEVSKAGQALIDFADILFPALKVYAAEEILTGETKEIPTTWKLDAKQSSGEHFSAQTEGEYYTYQLLLPEGYETADGVELPAIQIRIESSVATTDRSVTVYGAAVATQAASSGENITLDSTNLTAEELVGKLVAENEQFTASNAKRNGTVRTFSGAKNLVGFDSGIVLDTSGSIDGTKDEQLDQIKDPNYSYGGDTSSLEFSMVANGNMLCFNYVFASREFDQQAKYNDVFGLFVKVNDGDWQNIASITRNDGTQVPVNIVNLRAGMSGTEMNSGTSTSLTGAEEHTLFKEINVKIDNEKINGISNVFTALLPLEIGDRVTLKFAICDITDKGYNSYVFIEGDSLSFKGPKKTLTYTDSNGDTQTIQAEEGESVSAPEAPSREGYQFTGWNTELDGSGTAYQPGDSIDMTDNITLHPMWEAVKNTAQVEVLLDNEPWSGQTVELRQNGTIKYTLSEKSGENGKYSYGLPESEETYDLYVNGIDTDFDIDAKNHFIQSVDYYTVTVKVTDDSLWDDARVEIRDTEGNVTDTLTVGATEDETVIYRKILQKDTITLYHVYVDDQDVHKNLKITEDSCTVELNYYTAEVTILGEMPEFIVSMSNGVESYKFVGTDQVYQVRHVLLNEENGSELVYEVTVTNTVDTQKIIINSNRKNLTLQYWTVKYYTPNSAQGTADCLVHTVYVRNGSTVPVYTGKAELNPYTFLCWSRQKWSPSVSGVGAAFDYTQPITENIILYANFITHQDTTGDDSSESPEVTIIPTDIYSLGGTVALTVGTHKPEKVNKLGNIGAGAGQNGNIEAEDTNLEAVLNAGEKPSATEVPDRAESRNPGQAETISAAVTDQLPTETKKRLEDALKKLKEIDAGIQAGPYVQPAVNHTAEGAEGKAQGAVTGSATITVQIPEELRTEGRTFYLMMTDADGNIIILPNESLVDGTISVTGSADATYQIIYEDGTNLLAGMIAEDGRLTGTDGKTLTVSTNHCLWHWLILVITLLGLGAIALLGRKKKKYIWFFAGVTTVCDLLIAIIGFCVIDWVFLIAGILLMLLLGVILYRNHDDDSHYAAQA